MRIDFSRSLSSLTGRHSIRSGNLDLVQAAV